MRESLRLFACCLLIAALLPACGGGGSDASTPATDKYRIPAELWQAAAGQAPATGNYLRIESEANAPLIGAKNVTYTNLNALLSVDTSGNSVTVHLDAEVPLKFSLLIPQEVSGVQVGYYKDLNNSLPWAPAGYIDVMQGATRCDGLTGWVAIDHVKRVNNVVTELDLRFEQQCAPSMPGRTRARLHWTLANANAVLPGSPLPVPQGMWRADPAQVPASGSYLYLSGAQDHLYTMSNAQFNVSADRGMLSLQLRGDQALQAQVWTMAALEKFQPGYYPNLSSFVRSRNPLFGALEWVGENRHCEGTQIWFIVDAVAYEGEQLKSLDLRFEQACAGSTSTLRGQLHWRADELPPTPGPLTPAPSGLWSPPADFVPPSGNYVYMSSATGIAIAPFSMTAPISQMGVLYGPPGFHIQQDGYSMSFMTMEDVPRIMPGYYGGMTSGGAVNPLRARFFAHLSSPACASTGSWLVVDQAVYEGLELVALDARFESLCQVAGASPDLLRGAIHWVKPLPPALSAESRPAP